MVDRRDAVLALAEPGQSGLPREMDFSWSSR